MRRWSRSEWLLVAAVGGMGVLALRGAFRGHGDAVHPFNVGLGELVLVALIVLAIVGATRLR